MPFFALVIIVASWICTALYACIDVENSFALISTTPEIDKISVGSDGALWANVIESDDRRKLYSYNAIDGEWNKLDTEYHFLDISAVDADNIWAITDSFQAVHYNVGHWYNWGYGNTSGFKNVSAASDGTVYAIDVEGDLYNIEGEETWIKQSGSNYTAIAVGSADQVWAIKEYNVYQIGYVPNEGDPEEPFIDDWFEHIHEEEPFIIDVGEDGTLIKVNNMDFFLWEERRRFFKRVCGDFPTWTQISIASSAFPIYAVDSSGLLKMDLVIPVVESVTFPSDANWSKYVLIFSIMWFIFMSAFCTYLVCVCLNKKQSKYQYVKEVDSDHDPDDFTGNESERQHL